MLSWVSSFFTSAPAQPPPQPKPPRPIDTLSQLPEHLRGKGKNEIVDYVFRRFCDFGWEYDVGQDYGMPIIGAWPKYDPQDIQANCQALAVAFVEVLKRLDIDAEVRSVRKYVRGRRFVVKLKRFVDPQVTGNIKDQYGSVMRGFYLFREHYAVWVPAAQKYYDPMAKASYADLKPFVAYELVALDNAENLFISTDRRHLFEASQEVAPGNFYFYWMRDIRYKEWKQYNRILVNKGFSPKKRK